MGVWDVIKGIASSAQCAIGFHSGEWRHVLGKPECFGEIDCRNCHKHVTVERHKFGEARYTQYGDCKMVAICVYCGFAKFTEQHKYAIQGKDSSCHIIEVCQRCGAEKKGRIEHDWISNSSTGAVMEVNGKRKCRDCGMIVQK